MADNLVSVVLLLVFYYIRFTTGECTPKIILESCDGSRHIVGRINLKDCPSCDLDSGSEEIFPMKRHALAQAYVEGEVEEIVDEVVEETIHKVVEQEVEQVEHEIEEVVENKFEHEIEEVVENKFEHEIEEVVENKFEHEIEEVIENKFEHEIEEVIENKFEHEIEEVIENKFEHEIEEVIENKFERRIEEIIEKKFSYIVNHVVENKVEHIVEEVVNAVQGTGMHLNGILKKQQLIQELTEEINQELSQEIKHSNRKALHNPNWKSHSEHIHSERSHNSFEGTQTDNIYAADYDKINGEGSYKKLESYFANTPGALAVLQQHVYTTCKQNAAQANRVFSGYNAFNPYFMGQTGTVPLPFGARYPTQQVPRFNSNENSYNSWVNYLPQPQQAGGVNGYLPQQDSDMTFNKAGVQYGPSYSSVNLGPPRNVYNTGSGISYSAQQATGVDQQAIHESQIAQSNINLPNSLALTASSSATTQIKNNTSSVQYSNQIGLANLPSFRSHIGDQPENNTGDNVVMVTAIPSH